MCIRDSPQRPHLVRAPAQPRQAVVPTFFGAQRVEYDRELGLADLDGPARGGADGGVDGERAVNLCFVRRTTIGAG